MKIGITILVIECHYAESLYAECHYAECCNAECHNAECRNAECHNAECRDAECHNAECRNAECRNAECRNAECCYSACCYAECCYAECFYAQYRGALSSCKKIFSIPSSLFVGLPSNPAKNVNWLNSFKDFCSTIFIWLILKFTIVVINIKSFKMFHYLNKK